MAQQKESRTTKRYIDDLPPWFLYGETLRLAATSIDNPTLTDLSGRPFEDDALYEVMGPGRIRRVE